MFAILVFTCLFSAISDIKKGIIPNRVLLIACISEACLSAVYYSLFVRDIAFEYALNLCLVVRKILCKPRNQSN